MEEKKYSGWILGLLVVIILILTIALVSSNVYQSSKARTQELNWEKVVAFRVTCAVSSAHRYAQEVLAADPSDGMPNAMLWLHSALDEIDWFMYILSESDAVLPYEFGYDGGLSPVGQKIAGVYDTSGLQANTGFWADGVLDSKERAFIQTLCDDLDALSNELSGYYNRYYDDWSGPRERYAGVMPVDQVTELMHDIWVKWDKNDPQSPWGILYQEDSAS